jgi:galactokinase
MNVYEYLDSKDGEKRFEALYGKDDVNAQIARYKTLAEKTVTAFGTASVADLRFFSAPGRTELGGNHTDHNNGKVLCGSIQLDAVACVVPVDSSVVTLHSEGFPKPFVVNLKELKARKDEEGKTESLIRGIASEMKDRGYSTGGFSGCLTSTVLAGSGLSSSASIEVLIGTIYNHLYNKGVIPAVEIARMGQAAENKFFGKPCGLMDQVASASGGIVTIDFENPEEPAIETIRFDFEKHGYALVVVNTGGSHADLTADYAAIPTEMKAVAGFFGKKVMRQVKRQELFAKLPELRAKVGDRAILRAFHFIEDNKRVEKMVEALEEKDLDRYLKNVQRSGDSSWEILQNVFAVGSPSEQGVSLALTVTGQFLKGEGAYRVHGGGFAGTIQAYIPSDRLPDYVETMEGVFGPGCVTHLRIRPEGAVSFF